MSDFETWWEQEGQEFLYALNTTTDDDIKLVAEVAWENGAYKAEQQEPTINLDKLHEMNMQYVECPACGSDMAQAYSPKAEQQVTRADLKAAFKEGFERAADLYAPNDGQEPYAYEVWDVQDQSFTMIYATQLKEFHWIEPENIARVLYAAPVRTKDLTDDEERQVITATVEGVTTSELAMFKAVARAVLKLAKELNE